MNYFEYIPTLERKNRLLYLLEHLKRDYDKVSLFSQQALQKPIKEIEEELKMYRRRIYDFNTGRLNVIYEMTYEDYTDEELKDSDNLHEERKKQMFELLANCYRP